MTGVVSELSALIKQMSIVERLTARAYLANW